jgi:hypothetical protein
MVIRTQLLDEFAAAARIGMSVQFLRAARCRGTLGNGTPAPPYLHIGRSVRYDPVDLDAWLAACRVDPGGRKAIVKRRRTAAA